MRPKRRRIRLPGEEPPTFCSGPQGWGLPPPVGWGPPDWDPRDPREPPPPHLDPLRPPPPDWNPRGAPYWNPREPPYWDPRGPPPPDWEPSIPLHPDWGPSRPPFPHIDNPLPPPRPWGPPPQDFPPWGSQRFPAPPGCTPTPVPFTGVPPEALGPEPVPYPSSVPSFGYLSMPPPAWMAEPIREEPMLNPPPEQPEWIKALILAPSNEAPPVNNSANPVKEPSAETPPTPTPDVKEVKTAPKTFGLLGRRTFDRPPAGRSTGIISFIGPMFGYIEREDLEKFTFKFDAFFGSPKTMMSGVRVHFTACKQKNQSIATDVKVAPGGTENIDPEILEGVVSQPITEPETGERQYPGQLLVMSGPLRTNVTFERRDSSVSLLKDDKVLFNMLTDIVSNKKRATNIHPQIPATFTHTLEIRHKGVIVGLKENSGLVKSKDHGELPFNTKENFSEMDFTSEDIGEEVEFTVVELKVGKNAIRLKRVQESLLLALCSPNKSPGDCPSGKIMTHDELEPHMKLDTELYEGIVIQPIIRPTETQPRYPGQIHANIGVIRTNVTFDLKDCRVTLLKNDHVLINLLIDTQTDQRRATNIRAKVPFTFSYTHESRYKGVITNLDRKEGIVKSDEFGELPFDIHENFSDTEFHQEELQEEVEFTVASEDSQKKAIRLRRMKKVDGSILRGRKKQEEQLEQEDFQKENKKEAAVAALVAAKNKWTPLGFTISIPDSLEDISRERFEGTILQTIKPGSTPTKVEAEHGASESQQEVDPGEEGGAKAAGGRLVMTVDGEQKQITFGPRDIVSTPTMLVGDKVRFNIATNRESKVCRAMYVEILPDSFEESNEQRQQGIVIELSGSHGLIKCSQKEQLFFCSSEVIEKKSLELNEKVDFTIIPHECSAGGQQAIRIKRYVESIFLPARKFGSLAENKGKMTIKLAMSTEDPEVSRRKKLEGDKMKAIVKSLRSQEKRTKSSSHRSESPSPSPPTDRFGRALKKRQNPDINRDSRRNRCHRSREHSRQCSRSRSTSRTRNPHYRRRSQSPKPRRTKTSSSASRSRSRSKEKDRVKIPRRRSREREEKRKREPSSPHKPPGPMEEELARKKRELEELNDLIAYKKSLIDPRNQDPNQKTCIDYDHGRIAVPLAEYKAVRSILKNCSDEPEYSPNFYAKPLYRKPYCPLEPQQYRDQYSGSSAPYVGRPYMDRSSVEQPHEDQLYSTRIYGENPYESQLYEAMPHPLLRGQYPDRDKVLSTSFQEHLYNPYDLCDISQCSRGSSREHLSTTPTAAVPDSIRPLSPAAPPSGDISSKQKSTEPHQSPPPEKAPLDRFLEMLNKKSFVETGSKPGPVVDDLLPHERAFQDGKGFSRLVGLPQEIPGLSLEVEKNEPVQSVPSSEELTKEEKADSYYKIQNLLQKFGLKLNSGDVTKLASRAQEQIYSSHSSSSERQTRSLSREDQQTSRNGPVAADPDWSFSHARSSSLDSFSKGKMASSSSQGYLDRQEWEVQHFTKCSESTVFPPYRAPPTNWTVSPTSETAPPRTSTDTASSHQPRPSPGPPLRQSPEQPTSVSSSYSDVPFLLNVSSRSLKSAGPSQLQVPVTPQSSTPSSTSPSSDGQATISTTVARCLKVIETVKSLAVQSHAKSSKSVKFTIPIPPSSPISLDEEQLAEDIQAKQKEKLDLYSQRISEKREQQFREKLARRRERKQNEDLSPSIEKSSGNEQKHVWICGHSLVFWAESRAKSPEVGMQLGMDPHRVSVWWKGVQGMTWSQLLPQLHQLKVTWPNPDVLILHLGGNDLSTDSPTDLLSAVRKDLTSMRSIFPHCLLVWSNILPRRMWRHCPDSQEVDLVRSTVNRRIQNIVAELGGSSLSHDNIRCGANTGMYRSDGVHLSPKGIDVFNLNLQDFLEKWELSAASDSC